MERGKAKETRTEIILEGTYNGMSKTKGIGFEEVRNQKSKEKLAMNLLTGLVLRKRKQTLAICSGPYLTGPDLLGNKKARKDNVNISTTGGVSGDYANTDDMSNAAKAEVAGQTMPSPPH